jgi:hypothetical protein
LHAELEGKAGEDFLCSVTAEPRPLFFGNPASSFHPRFTFGVHSKGSSYFMTSFQRKV